MTCNNVCNNDSFILELTKGNSKRIEITLNELLDGYFADFVIRKNLQSPAIVKKTVEVIGKLIVIELQPDETDLLTLDNSSSSRYVWGVDVFKKDDVEDIRVSIIPKTGAATPICIVYSDVAYEKIS